MGSGPADWPVLSWAPIPGRTRGQRETKAWFVIQSVQMWKSLGKGSFKCHMDPWVHYQNLGYVAQQKFPSNPQSTNLEIS